MKEAVSCRNLRRPEQFAAKAPPLPGYLQALEQPAYEEELLAARGQPAPAQSFRAHQPQPQQQQQPALALQLEAEQFDAAEQGFKPEHAACVCEILIKRNQMDKLCQ